MKYGSNVWLVTGMSYLDRAAAFLCPLIVLKVIGRPDAYVSIEYVLSLSIILATFFDAGLGNYLLFDSKERHSDKAALLSAAIALRPLLWLHILGVLLALALGWLGSSTVTYLIALAIARASALSVTRLVMQGMILVGRPVLAPLMSIISWAFSCIILACPTTASDIVLTTVFFCGSLAILVGAIGLTVWSDYEVFDTKSITNHLGRSLKWGWPLLLSAAGAMVVANYSKVYAFSNLPAREVTAFIFWMRAYSIVQLSHVAIVSILTRQIYQAKNPGILPDNIYQYARFISPSALLVGGAALFGGSWVPTLPFLSMSAAAVMFVYFCVWCFGAYLEVYLNRNGQNSIIFKASLVSSGLYVLGILVGGPVDALHLSALMAFSATVYTGIIACALRVNK